MTELRGLVAWVALTVLSTTLIAAPERISRGTKVSEQEPFHSFRILDGKMTLLAHQQDVLKSYFNPEQTRSRSLGSASAWPRPPRGRPTSESTEWFRRCDGLVAPPVRRRRSVDRGPGCRIRKPVRRSLGTVSTRSRSYLRARRSL